MTPKQKTEIFRIISDWFYTSSEEETELFLREQLKYTGTLEEILIQFLIDHIHRY